MGGGVAGGLVAGGCRLPGKFIPLNLLLCLDCAALFCIASSAGCWLDRDCAVTRKGVYPWCLMCLLMRGAGGSFGACRGTTLWRSASLRPQSQVARASLQVTVLVNSCFPACIKHPDNLFRRLVLHVLRSSYAGQRRYHYVTTMLLCQHCTT